MTSWFDDTNDKELLNLIPYLETLAEIDNVYSILLKSNEQLSPDSISASIDETKTFYPTYDNKQKPKAEVSVNNTDHLKTQQSTKKLTTLIKRNYNISDADISSTNSTDSNNNPVKVLNETSSNNTDDASTLSDNSIVLNLDMASNKLRLSRQQRDILVEE